jgi:hypothetical protein
MTDGTIAALMVEEFLILPAQESSAVRAQRFVRRVLVESDVENEAVDLAVLLTKALIINGLLHSESEIVVSVKVRPDSIRVEVADDRHLLANGGRSWGVASISR